MAKPASPLLVLVGDPGKPGCQPVFDFIAFDRLRLLYICHYAL